MPHTSRDERRAEATPEQLAARDLHRAELLARMDSYERSLLYRILVWWDWRDIHWLHAKARVRQALNRGED